MEIGLAVRESKYSVGKVLGVARRLRAETPDAWDAWLAGDIDQDRAVRISRALRLVVREESKRLLNHLVVDVAVCETAELLGRWLNQFVARVEPDQSDERIRRSMSDRYVSVRPDVDGVSFLSAMVSSVDAVAIDQVLAAVAAIAEPGDERNVQQRRADALVDVLLGRMSNGCTTPWDTNSDDDEVYDDAASDDADDQVGGSESEIPAGAEEVDAEETGTDESAATDADTEDVDADAHGIDSVDVDDWELPASAFRPDPPRGTVGLRADICWRGRRDRWCRQRRRVPRHCVSRSWRRSRRWRRGGCPRCCRHRWHAAPAGAGHIGVIVSAASLFGFSNTPGQLADRSALAPADTIRDLAARPGTLFHRLVTDERGNLLDVTELGRFPSRKLGPAIGYRDGVCTNPVCHVPAARCDLDHVIAVPEGPTTASNLDGKCRSDHRAKTHGGHHTSRTGQHSGEWRTPTGHTYRTHDEPLPVESWPVEPSLPHDDPP